MINYSYWYSPDEMKYTKELDKVEEGIIASNNSIIFGPYCYLSAGDYEIEIYADGLSDDIGVEMASGETLFPVRNIDFDKEGLSFVTTINENSSNSEVRLFTSQNNILFKGMSIRASGGM